MILGLPALRALRRHFPRSAITFAAPEPQVRLGTWEPLVDRVVGFGEPALARLIAGTATAWPGMIPEPDLAIVWLRDHEAVADTMHRLGVRHVVGRSPMDAVTARVHMADWLFASLELLAVAPSSDTGALRAPGGDRTSRDIVLHPSSGSPRKNWSGWPTVLSALGAERVTLVAGTADTEPLASVLRRVTTGAESPEILSGLTLEELAGVLTGAQLYLGNDSGVSHLAAALGTPSIVVFGPTDPQIWSPVGPRVTTLGGTHVSSGIFSDAPAWPTFGEVLDTARAALDQTE
ncbi:MAG: glycosyltransferase family 9 protein [Chloroflexota bacterium]